MRYVSPPHRTDKSISYENWEQLYRENKKLLNINFDPTTFNTIEDSTGIYVTIIPQNTTDENTENDHSWHFEQLTNNSGTVTQGKCYLGGVEYSVNGWSSNVSGVITDTDYWIELHRDGTASTMFYWKSGATGTEPAATDTLEAIPILEFVTDDGAITSVIERLQSDVRITLFG